MMTREQILAKRTVKTETVDVPEWDGTFEVRGLSAIDRVRFFDSADVEKMQAENTARIGVALLIECLHNSAGVKVFQPDDAAALEQQDGGLIERLCTVVNRINGLGVSAEKK